jgi:hypothetical protein
MTRKPTHFTWGLYFFLVLLFGACNRDETSKVFETHLEKYPDVRKKYIYQSVLRLANIQHDRDFDKLIKDVRRITIYLPPREDSTYQIKEVSSGMRADGYEELMSVKTASNERISLWINESLPKPHYVGLLDTSTEDYIFEIDGQLDLEYISSLNMADQSSLRDLLN